MTNNSITRMLAGTSAVALTLGLAIAVPSLADVLIIDANDQLPVTIDGDYDGVKVDGAVVGTVTNNAKISNTSGDGEAIGIEVDPSLIDGDLVNSTAGLIEIDATETGIGIFVTESSEVTGAIVNDGMIDIDVVSDESGDGNADISRGAGIWQSRLNSGDETMTAENLGTIDVTATATNDENSDSVSIEHIYGILQEFDGDSGDAHAVAMNGATAAASSTALDPASIVVFASGTNTTSGRARVDVEQVAGIYQDVWVTDSGASGSASAMNTGTIDVTAIAKATSTSDDANLSGDYDLDRVYGIFQEVEASGAASATAENAGAITVLASAVATATGSGSNDDAWVQINNSGDEHVAGIFQLAEGDSGGKAEATNTGTIDVTAKATALASGGSGDAEINHIFGIYQEVDADDSGDATAIALNGSEVAPSSTALHPGLISVFASAVATAQRDAEASAGEVAGIYQDVWSDSGNGSASAYNSGTIDVTAIAKATSLSGDTGVAEADAEEAFGIFQEVDASSGDASASAFNAGGITVLASAVASANGSGGGNAYANVNNGEGDNVAGIWQDVSGDSGSASATNIGTIDVTAKATATSAGESADAEAEKVFGIYQAVESNSADATALAMNGTLLAASSTAPAHPGSITVFASSVATGNNNTNDAEVEDVAGIWQEVSGDIDATAWAYNNGTIDVTAIAKATALASGGSGDAEVDKVYGIYQEVSGGGEAFGTATNVGSITVLASAVATATGSGSGDNAIADVDDVAGIWQEDVSGDNDALADATNTGSIDVTAKATALASGGSGDAEIEDIYGIYQDVSGDGGDATALAMNGTLLAASATAPVHPGSITVFASSVATGNNNTNDAEVEDVAGIWQEVSGDNDGTAWAYNNGTIDVTAIAKATASSGGVADASDENDNDGVEDIYGIYQDVSGDGEAFGTATNVGSITVLASAVATATGSGSNDDAIADAEDVGGIWQVVDGDNDALADATNTGSIDVTAKATATSSNGSGDAEINDIYGIYQYVDGNSGDATALAMNGTLLAASATAPVHPGSITVFASSVATGNNNRNYADVDDVAGIWQEVSGDNDGTAWAYNNGTIDVTAIAKATALASGGSGDAEIDDVYGIFQDVSGDSGAFGTATNVGSITVLASAVATATGSGSERDVSADASDVAGIWQGDVSGDSDALADATNTGSIDVTAKATALASGGPGDAEVEDIYGIYQYVSGDSGDATAIAMNGTLLAASATAPVHPGSITVFASSVATGNNNTNDAEVERVAGIWQEVSGGNDGTAWAYNNGTIDVTAIAKATASSGGVADASDEAGGYNDNGAENIYGIYQEVSGGGEAFGTATNVGSITVLASTVATATGSGSSDNAYAEVEDVGGIWQDVSGDNDALADATNTGSIDVTAKATATSSNGSVDARVDDIYGIYQYVSGDSGDATALAMNGTLLAASATAPVHPGSITVFGSSVATGEDAKAETEGLAGIMQEVEASGDATAWAYNSGTINVTAKAKATASSGVADVDGDEQISEIFGIYQDASGDGDGFATATNAGSITVLASAVASATGSGSDDDADAEVNENIAGIWQDVDGDSVEAKATNTGSIDVTAKATATSANGSGDARVDDIFGIYQDVSGDGGDVSALVANGSEIALSETAVHPGSITLFASALATAPSGDAVAEVDDVEGVHMALWTTSDTLTADFVNSGEISVTAKAGAQADTSSGSANADATARGVHVVASVLEGRFLNSGSIEVDVSASATGDTAEASARALGLHFEVDEFNATVLNEGADAKIMAFAQATAADEATAEATAVLFEDYNSVHEVGGEGLLVNNSGMIWAGIVEDGGDIVRATAINTRGTEENETKGLIHQEWKGEKHWGRIFGDVNIKEDETITVSDGITKFNGVVNSDREMVGEMTIIGAGDAERDPGALFLAMTDSIAPQQLAPQVNVESFTQEAGGTLWFEINAPEDDTPVGAGPADDGNFIGQINANDVSLDGDAVLRVVQPQVFPDAFTYEDVVQAANSGTGAWDSLTSWTPLLDPTAVYNGNWGAGTGTTVDIDVLRVPFDMADLSGVGGFTDNTHAVAGGLEGGYPGVLAGTTPADFDLLVGTLFTLNDAEYSAALNQLTGSIYPQGLWSITNSLDMFKRAANARTMSQYWEAPDRKLTFWFNGQLARGDVDGDENAPGFDHDRESIHGGLDYRATDELTVGAAIGYFSADLDFDDFGGKMDYDGVQIGLYGEYEVANWHINVIGAYGNYGGDTKRNVNIDRVQDAMECGCIPDIGLESVNKGDIDASAWMLSAEVGHTFDLDEQKRSAIAPYAGITYHSGDLDSFTESVTGTASGSALEIDGDGKSLVLDLGARLSHDFPISEDTDASVQLRAAWLHDFGDRPYEVDASFAGVAGSSFEVEGSNISRDTIALDLGVAVEVTNQVLVGFAYNGRLNSDVTDHAVMGRVEVKF